MSSFRVPKSEQVLPPAFWIETLYVPSPQLDVLQLKALVVAVHPPEIFDGLRLSCVPLLSKTTLDTLGTALPPLAFTVTLFP